MMASIVSKHFLWGGITDVGYGREQNEDAVRLVDLSEDVTLLIVTDGTGSRPGGMQPAQIVNHEIESMIRRIHDENKELLISEPGLFLRESLLVSNRVLGAFVIANEEKNSGFGASCTVCLLYGRDNFCFAHCGNTRLYLLREKSDKSMHIRQLTRDHTKAIRLVDEGLITVEEYHTHPDRLTYTSGLGNYAYPDIQIFF